MSAETDALLARVQRDIDSGLLPSCQVALARNGELELFEAFGDATTDTRFIAFSATKAFVAAAFWTLLAEGLVDEHRKVVDYLSKHPLVSNVRTASPQEGGGGVTIAELKD